MKKWLLLLVSVCSITAIMVGVMLNDWFQPAQTPNPAIGLLEEVSEERLILQTDEGQNISFTNQVQDVPVEHLKEHQTDKERVSITWHADGDKKLATRIDDAP